MKHDFDHLNVMNNSSKFLSNEILILRRVPRRSVTIFWRCLAFIGLLAVPFAYSQSGEPRTIDVDVPFEMIAPWVTPEGELEDEVRLQGTLHVTTRTWASTPGIIDRFYLHANAVNIHGTSETTGQRYRLNGSFNFDLRDPEVTFNPDGSFNIPFQPSTLRLHKVDPGPATLTANLYLMNGATATPPNIPPPMTVPCERKAAPDGTPTAWLDCGDFIFSWYARPVPYIYRVLGSRIDGCTPVVGNLCSVPDGAILFNGYNPVNAYRPPLVLQTKSYEGSIGIINTRIDWHCKTGDREAPLFPIGGGDLRGCRPIYSSTAPITVYAEISYQAWQVTDLNGPMQLVSFVVREAPFTFHMLERLIDQPPTIHDLSVRAVSRINDRCAIGELCDLIDGDIIYNQQVGDYDPLLHMEMSASDPEGDPIFVEWFCRSGSNFAPVTNQGSLAASCTAPYNYPEPIQVYAIVSDGNNSVVTLPVREFYMLEFIQ